MSGQILQANEKILDILYVALMLILWMKYINEIKGRRVVRYCKLCSALGNQSQQSEATNQLTTNEKGEYETMRPPTTNNEKGESEGITNHY